VARAQVYFNQSSHVASMQSYDNNAETKRTTTRAVYKTSRDCSDTLYLSTADRVHV